MRIVSSVMVSVVSVVRDWGGGGGIKLSPHHLIITILSDEHQMRE